MSSRLPFADPQTTPVQSNALIANPFHLLHVVKTPTHGGPGDTITITIKSNIKISSPICP